MEKFTVEIDGFLAEDVIADNAEDAAWKYCFNGQIYDQLITNRGDEYVSVLDEDAQSLDAALRAAADEWQRERNIKSSCIKFIDESVRRITLEPAK